MFVSTENSKNRGWVLHEMTKCELQTKEFNADESMALVMLWVLADKLLMPRLQILAANKLWKAQCSMNVTFANCFTYVYEKTTKGNPLRLLFLHQCAAYLGPAWFAENKSHYPVDLLLELIALQSQFRSYFTKYVGLRSDDTHGMYQIIGKQTLFRR